MCRLTCCGSALLRAAALSVGCLAAGTAYTLDSFTVYSTDLKELFEASQSEVESAVSMGYIGLLSSLPTGLLYRRVGPKILSFIALLFGSVGAIMLLTTLYNIKFYSDNFGIISAFYFSMGFGGGIMYVTASSVSMTNYDDKLLGLISGIIHAFRSGIPGFLMVCYMYFFSKDYSDIQYKRDRLFIFCVALIVLYVSANVLGIIIYDDYRERQRFDSVLDGSTKRKSRRRLDTNSLTESTPLVAPRRAKHQHWWNYLKELDYHLVFWPSIIMLGFRTAFGSNISTFAGSFGLYDYAQIVMSILPIVSTFSKPPIGWCSDASITFLPRSAFLLTWALLDCIILGFCLFFFDKDVMQGVALMVIVIASSYIQTLAPPLLVAMFGRTFFPIGWSLITVGWAGCTSLFNILVGAFYDAHIEDENTRTCVGMKCYRYTFLIALAATVLASVFYGILLYRERKYRRRGISCSALEESIHT